VVDILKILIIGAILTLLLAPTSAIFIAETSDDGQDKSRPVCEEIDAVPPVSEIVSTPKIEIFIENTYYYPSIFVKWSGVDNPDGSGVKYYDVQIKRKYFGPDPHAMVMPYWEDWYMNTTETSAYLDVNSHYVYYFRCRAVDKAGNAEPWPVHAQAVSVAVGLDPVTYEEIIEKLKEYDIPRPIKERLEENDPRPERLPEDRPDIIPPESRVLPLFPIHFWMDGLVKPADRGIITIQVEPRIPIKKYPIEWLEEAGLITTRSNYAEIDVSWIGTDFNGSGILSYDVRYKGFDVLTAGFAPEEEPYRWRDWITNTTETERTFKAYFGGPYAFQCRAHDNAGNVENYPVTADTTVYIIDLRLNVY
jgi:hypothetical protein